MLTDIWTEVLSGALLFLIGSRRSNRHIWLRTRRARRFWGGSGKKDRTLVLLGAVPPLEKFVQYEPSGMIGWGDSKASQNCHGS